MEHIYPRSIEREGGKKGKGAKEEEEEEEEGEISRERVRRSVKRQ